MSAEIVPLRPSITSCSHCDKPIVDGQTTVSITVARETWHDGDIPTVDVHHARAALIYCMACADLFNFDHISVVKRDAEPDQSVQCVPFVDGPWQGTRMHSGLGTFEVEDGSDEMANPLTLSPEGVGRTRYFLQLRSNSWVWSVEVPENANELLAAEAQESARLLGEDDRPKSFMRSCREVWHTIRYAVSVAGHFLTGKLTGHHALYALRARPVAVASKGKIWIVDPSFQV